MSIASLLVCAAGVGSNTTRMVHVHVYSRLLQPVHVTLPHVSVCSTNRCVKMSFPCCCVHHRRVIYYITCVSLTHPQGLWLHRTITRECSGFSMLALPGNC